MSTTIIRIIINPALILCWQYFVQISEQGVARVERYLKWLAHEHHLSPEVALGRPLKRPAYPRLLPPQMFSRIQERLVRWQEQQFYKTAVSFQISPTHLEPWYAALSTVTADLPKRHHILFRYLVNDLLFAFLAVIKHVYPSSVTPPWTVYLWLPGRADTG